MSEFFPSFTHLADVLNFQVDRGCDPIRWVLSEEFADHLADLSGLEREAVDEPMEVMGVVAVVLPVQRHWELLVQRGTRLVYVRPGGSK